MMTVIGPLLVLALVLALRLRRPGREKALSGVFLWLPPMLYLAAVAVVLTRHPPTPIGWLLLLAGLVGGAALGWARGRMFALRVDLESGAVLHRRSRAAVLLLVGIVALRFLANLWISPADPGGAAAALLVTDTMMGLVLGMLVVTRIEIAIRARRLLASHLVERSAGRA